MLKSPKPAVPYSVSSIAPTEIPFPLSFTQINSLSPRLLTDISALVALACLIILNSSSRTARKSITRRLNSICSGFSSCSNVISKPYSLEFFSIKPLSAGSSPSSYKVGGLISKISVCMSFIDCLINRSISSVTGIGSSLLSRFFNRPILKTAFVRACPTRS